MKKLILLLLLTTMANAQVFISTGVDIRNALVGSKPTKNNPELDFYIQLHLVDRHVDVSVGYEIFNKIGFEKYNAGIGYIFPLYCYIGDRQIKTTLLVSVEPTIIGRWKTNTNNDWGNTSSHLTIGASTALKWDISDRLSIGVTSNLLPRTDLNTKYPNEPKHIVYSNYLTFYYKLN